MDRALVVVDDTAESRELLAEAGALAAGVGADLVLFTWLTPEAYEQDTAALEAVERAEQTSYDADALDGARTFAADLATDVFEEQGVDVEFDVTAAVADDDALADEILATAGALDCDHVFVVGRRRSPAGKVIFGDVAQTVVLTFDGAVTVTVAGTA